jgi:hypothetical protein
MMQFFHYDAILLSFFFSRADLAIVVQVFAQSVSIFALGVL